MNTDIQDVYHKTRPNFSYMKDQNLLRKILKETSYNNKQSKIQTRNEIFQGGYINYRDLQKIGGSITNNFSNLTDNIDRRVNVNINIPTTGLGKRYHRLENIRNYGNPLSMDPELENDKDDYLEEISKNKKTQRFRRYLEHRKNYQVPQITLHTEYELKPKKESEERFGLTTFREENNSGNYPEEVPVLSEPIVGNKFEEKREYPNISSQWNKRFCKTRTIDMRQFRHSDGRNWALDKFFENFFEKFFQSHKTTYLLAFCLFVIILAEFVRCLTFLKVVCSC